MSWEAKETTDDANTWRCTRKIREIHYSPKWKIHWSRALLLDHIEGRGTIDVVVIPMATLGTKVIDVNFVTMVTVWPTLTTITIFLNVSESDYNFFPTNFSGNSHKYLRALFALWSDDGCWRLYACLMRTTRVQIDEIIVGLCASLNIWHRS